MSVKTLPIWIWGLELLGVGLVVVGGATSGYPQAVELAFGTALLLVLPLGVVQRALEERLAVKIAEVVTESVAAAASKRLSGPPAPLAPEDLDLWPFTAVAERAGSQMRLRLTSTGSVMSSLQPIEAMVVVTDPIGRTFSTDRKLRSIVEKDVTDWIWPDNFTSGDIRGGIHTVEFFVAPLSAGPARRFGLAAEAQFEYEPTQPDAPP
jgi:hypothetical protein